MIKPGMRTFLFVLLLLIATGTAYSFSTLQTPPEPQNSTDACCTPPVGLPIDMGLSALLASGIGLGIIFLKRKK